MKGNTGNAKQAPAGDPASGNQRKAYLYAMITVLFWSTVASAFKIALVEYNYIRVLLLSNFTALVILSVAVLTRHQQLRAGLTGRMVALSAAQGLLNPFLYYLILFRAYTILPAQVAQPVNFIWPVVLMLLSVPLLGQKMRLTGLASLLLSFSGVLLLATRGRVRDFSIQDPGGIALAMTSSVIWALFWILNMKDKRDDIVKLFLSFGFSFFFILITAAVTGNLRLPVNRSFYASVYTGTFEMGVTFILWLKALHFSESTGKVSNIVYLTPFLSLVIIHFILGEKIYWTSVAGLTLVIAGILLQQIKKPAPATNFRK
jgi:drug/metabolite transporter (DMT)-like permease